MQISTTKSEKRKNDGLSADVHKKKKKWTIIFPLSVCHSRYNQLK